MSRRSAVLRRPPSLLAAGAAGVALVVAGAPTQAATGQGAATRPGTPRWVLHVQRFPGGISNGVRAQLDPSVLGARAAAARRGTRLVLPPITAGPNVQMNDDSEPPLPQNETAVAYSLHNPLVAVAAANDYVAGGVVVMRTGDGGRHWASTRVVPQFRATGDFCTGGDPAVAYSRRDRAFYLSQLCFFRALPHSEVLVHVSTDNGKTWTPGRQAARAASTFDYTTGKEDVSNFNDKEYIAVDNTPTSPHYGRLYVTYTKFHLLPDGTSDYCPIQLSYSDNVPSFNPFLATFARTPVQPDAPGSGGVGSSANQFSVPQVERNGTLDIGFVSENCNNSLDPHLLFQRSTDGGVGFLPAAVQIDKPGRYADNPDTADLLPPTAFRAPNTTSIDYNTRTGTLSYFYQNNIDRATSGANISYQQSRDGGLTWSDAKVLSVGAGGAPARGDQFFPWAASTPSGKLYAIWFDRRRDPANRSIDTWQAVSTDDGRHWTTGRISTAAWNPDLGFFTLGNFIGDYNGLAANDRAVYPVWTDGRASAIARTGIGETDIWTNVEIGR